jgi:DNA-binding GntR family transcriptional regulator
MPHATAISRSVLSDRVKDRLLQAILAGHYPPGSRIVETRAAREFGTSQAPVREALRDLEALGVVEIAAFRGARVRRPSTSELLEAYAVRSELEALGVRLAMPLLADADLDELRGYVDKMRRAAEKGDVHGEATADASFHGRLVEIADNATLLRVWRQLEPFSRTYITIVVPGADRRRIAELHVPVLEALRGRDPEAAATAIHRHFADARSMLAGLWVEPEPSQAGEGASPARRAPVRRAGARHAATRTMATEPQPSERTR